MRRYGANGRHAEGQQARHRTHDVQGQEAELSLQADRGRRCDKARRLPVRGRLLAANFGTHRKKAARAMAVSHATGRVFHFWRRLWRLDTIVLFAFGPVVILLVILNIKMFTSPFDSEERKVCDTAVDALLNSRDLIEVQRAGILIDQLSCSVARRLPQP